MSTASGVITLKIREWSKITKITRILVAAMQPPCILVILVIKLSKNQQLSALLFADDQVITADREDNLQSAAHKLNQIITEYGLTISVQKTKSMAFRGRDPVRTKTVIHSIHSAVCLTTGPKPLPKRALHIVRSRASSFK